MLFAGLGAASFGLFDAARALQAGRLDLGAAGALALLAAGAVTAAAFGVGVGLLAAPLPPRPAGRTRWGAFLLGLVVAVAAQSFIVLFTDPPPVQEPPPLHGSVPAWLASCAGLGVLALGLYQAVRGAGNVASAVLVLAAAGGAWAWSSGEHLPPPRSPPPAHAPDVLLVTLDTARADHFGAYGSTASTTRHFDALAAEGVLFQSASAVAAVTGPSHAAMLSGTGPWENGVLLNGVPLPDDRPLLAERLHESGWATAAFVSAYVLDGGLGFDRGFTVYDDDFGLLPGFRDLLLARAIDMAHRHADPDWVLERRGADTVDHALGWIQAQEGPWFAWVHLFDPHGPYLPPPPWDTAYYSGDPRDPAYTSMATVGSVATYLRPFLHGITDLNYVLAQYAGEISYADAQLGRLLAAVGPDTVVLVIGDHGESLGEHGVWFNHGDDLYETSLHVPFALRWPGRTAPGVVTAPVSGADVAPTVLGGLGLSIEGMSGHDALAADRVHAPSMCFDRDTNLAERKAGRITAPKWRLAGLRSGAGRWVQREFDDRGELFELANDPAGVNDRAGDWTADPEKAAALDSLRGQTDELLRGDTTRSAVELSDEERARLEALGYLDP